MAGRPRKNVALGGEGTVMDQANVTGAAGTTRKQRAGTRRRKRGAGVGTVSNLTGGTRRNIGGHDIASFQAGAEWAMGLGQRGTRQIRTQHRRQGRKATV